MKGQLKQVDEMPESGQFVAVYWHEGKAWSFTIKRQFGTLLQYNDGTDQYEDHKLSAIWLKTKRPIYFTA